ncbi:unnamed protein product [Closterium sp. NIES-65]|nr:unnamed protein product [Closterium sp. NIES-65]
MAISSGSISESAFRGVAASRSIRSLSEFAGRPVATNAILTGACKHRASSPRPITFSLQSHIIASTSASAASSAAMGSATVPASGGGVGGEAAPFRQMTPEEHWWWGTPEFMMGNWHGQWRSWKPLESTDENRSMKSVRKLWATSPDRSSFAHVNDWYDFQGEAPAYMPKVGVQWDMSLAQHSLPDGFCHVVASKSRRYAVSRQADAIWGPIEVADGAGGMMLPFFIEFFFAHTTTTRLACSIQYQVDGALRTSVAVEETLDNNEHRPADWVPPAWGQGCLSSHLPDHLPPVPALDDKTVVGTRTVLTRNLMVQERENVSWAEEWNPNGTTAAADTAAAAAAGFMGRVPQGDEEQYAVVSLPQQVVVCAPRSLQLVAGRPFVLSVSWVVGAGLVGEGEVKRITAYWGADGGFEKVEGEWYRREA